METVLSFVQLHWQLICLSWSVLSVVACGLYWLLVWDLHHGPFESWPSIIGTSIVLIMCGPISALVMAYRLGEPNRQARKVKKQYSDLADEIIERTGGNNAQ